MKLLHVLFFFILVAFCHAEGKPKAEKLSKGIIKRGNTIKVSRKYSIVKDGNGARVVEKRRSSGGISGRFDCKCNESPDDGSSEGACYIVFQPVSNEVKCVNSSSCQSCAFDIVFDPSTPPVMQNGPKH